MQTTINEKPNHMYYTEVNLYNLRETYSLWDHEQEKHDQEHKHFKEKHIAEQQRMPHISNIPHTHLPAHLYGVSLCVIANVTSPHMFIHLLEIENTIRCDIEKLFSTLYLMAKEYHSTAVIKYIFIYFYIMNLWNLLNHKIIS